MKTIAVPLLLAFVTSLGIGCQKAPDKPAKSNGATSKSSSQDKEAATEYPIRGKVVDVQAKSITLDHDDIPGLMKGMEMKFEVDDEQVVKGVQAGDQVRGQLEVQGNRYVITELSKE